MADRSKKNETQVQLQKLQRAEDGKKAMADHLSEAAATRAKTERLKALRLARDAAEAAAAPATAPAKKKSAKKKKAASGNLSEWLKGRADSGHNS